MDSFAAHEANHGEWKVCSSMLAAAKPDRLAWRWAGLGPSQEVTQWLCKRGCLVHGRGSPDVLAPGKTVLISSRACELGRSEAMSISIGCMERTQYEDFL